MCVLWVLPFSGELLKLFNLDQFCSSWLGSSCWCSHQKVLRTNLSISIGLITEVTPPSYVSYLIKIKTIVIATIKYYQLCIIKKSICLFLNCCESNPVRTLLMSKSSFPKWKVDFFALERGERKRPPVFAAISAVTIGCRSPSLSHSWRTGGNKAGCSQGYFVFMHPGFHVLLNKIVLSFSTLERFNGNKVELWTHEISLLTRLLVKSYYWFGDSSFLTDNFWQ